MAASGSNKNIRIGMLKLDATKATSKKTDTKPASCDQNSDLKEPICAHGF